MLLSKYFLPIKWDTIKNETLVSHKLMMQAGMIKQVASGLYSMLPLGLKVLKKIENIIREELNKEGFHEILMPTIQPAELWKESQRYGGYGDEMLKFKDRHQKEFLYGPTAEEVATLIGKEIKSYRELPCVLYNIQWKFRDEIRPRFGLMRAREFLMMDSYSFDSSEELAKITYNKHYDAYLRIFARMGLTAIPMQADTGEIGGDLSHEFHIIAPSGESEIFYDEKLEKVIQDIKSGTASYNLREEITKYYAKTAEKHNEEDSKNLSIVKKRGIEVGHNFYFGTKYSSSMQLKVQNEKGELFFPLMGSYGIGVGRLLAAFIEANHDENGIIWNKNISPFDFYIIDLTKEGQGLKFYEKIKSLGFDPVIDDIEKKKFERSQLLGIPLQIVISEKLLKEDIIEIKDRNKTESVQIQVQEFFNIFLKNYAKN